MAYSNVFTKNDEVKHRILNVYAKFVSDVEPDRLSDWLVQEHVITIDQKQRMHRENLIASDRCRAILDHLFSIQHPRAFLVVRQALKEGNHYLLETIDNQEPGTGIHVQPQEQSVLHAKIQELEKDLMRYRSVNAQLRKNKDDLEQQMHQLESELRSQKSKAQLEKRSWEVERDCLVKKQNEKRAWEVERDCLLKKQNELEAKLRTAKVAIQQLEKDKEDRKRAQEAENSRRPILHMPKELETNLHLAPLTNDEIRGRIQNIWSKFVSGVEPDRLSDWLVQENVITSDQWQRILTEHSTRQSRCRALLHFLYSIPHPRAFLVVYQYLTEDGHYLLESIDASNQD